MIFKHDIFESDRVIRLLIAPYFDMYNNVPKKSAISTCKDQRKPITYHIVLVEEFVFKGKKYTAKYDKFVHHAMIHDLCLACCLGCRVLCNQLCCAETVNTINGRPSHEYETNILQSLSECLYNCQYINDMEIVGAIGNPLFKYDGIIINTELLTKDHFQYGK